MQNQLFWEFWHFRMLSRQSCSAEWQGDNLMRGLWRRFRGGYLLRTSYGTGRPSSHHTENEMLVQIHLNICMRFLIIKFQSCTSTPKFANITQYGKSLPRRFHSFSVPDMFSLVPSISLFFTDGILTRRALCPLLPSPLAIGHAIRVRYKVWKRAPIAHAWSHKSKYWQLILTKT